MLLTLTRMLTFIAFVALANIPSYAPAQNDMRTITVRDLATLRDLDGLNVSPDGRWAALVVMQAILDNNGYEIAWHVSDLVQGRTRRVAAGGDMLPSSNQGLTVQYAPPSVSVWSADSAWLSYLRRDDGRTQIWRVRHNGGGAHQLTHTKADVRALAYSRDGRQILFETEPSRDQLTQAMAAEAQTGFLYDQRFAPMFSRLPTRPRDHGRGFAARPAESEIAARRVWVYELASGRARSATEAEQVEYTALTAPARRESGPNTYNNFSAASLDGALAWTEARDPHRQGFNPPKTIVAQFSAASAPIACANEACASGYLRDLLWRNDEELVFNRRDGGRAADNMLYAWRPNDVRPPRLIVSTPGRMSGCRVARDRLVCLYARSEYPGRLVAFDLDSGAMEILYDPNPSFAQFNVGNPPQRITIRADSGAETTGYLVLPPNHRLGSRLPLVIVTYDCSGFLRGGVGDEYPIYAFAAQGFAVLCYNSPDDLDRQARLDGPSHTYWARGPGVGMRHRVEDTLAAALAQLDRMGIIDPQRIGITGLSYGAEIVFFALPHLPQLTAAIASGGARGPSQYPYDGRVVRELMRRLDLGAPDETPERWDEISFSARAENVYAPLLINVDDMEFLWALDSVTALEDAGRAVEMYVFPDEYHVKWQPAHRLAIYNRNIDWMKFWLQGREDSAPAKAEQYKRWRAMRVKQCELFKGADAPWYCKPSASTSPSN